MKFIRKNSRVIPIRDGSNSVAKPAHFVADQSKNKDALMAVGLFKTSLGAGIGAQVTVGALKHSISHQHVQGMQVASFAKHVQSVTDRHSDLYKRAGSPAITPGPSSHANFGALRGTTPHIRLSHANEDVLLHEIGHLAKSREAGTANNIIKRIATSIVREPSVPKRVIKTAVFLPLRTPLVLKAEAEATGVALKAAYKAGGAKSLVRGLKVLGPAYATYALGAVATYSLLGGVGYAMKYNKDRWKNRKK